MTRAFVLFLFLFAFAGSAATAQESRSIIIDDFASEIRVSPDGFTEVIETLRIDFRGSWQGLIREVSLHHETAEGRRQRLTLNVLNVTDEAGNDLRYETSRSGTTQEIKFWVTDANNAIRTARIHYRLENVLRFFGDGDSSPEEAWDELYWNVTGNDWGMPIRSASARVILPSGAERVQAWAYTGRAGSTDQDASVEISDNVVDVASNRALQPNEGLTVSVTWAPGLVDRTAFQPGLFDRVRDWWALALPFLTFGWMFSHWRRNGREPRRGPITVRYEPPEDMSAAELGTLVDNKAHMHDITATLVDLAVRGYVLIEEEKSKRWFGLGTKTEYHFHLLRPRSEWDDLKKHERQYLQGMFPSSRSRISDSGAQKVINGKAVMATVKLSSLSNRFYKHLEKIRTSIYEGLIKRGYFKYRPDKSRGRMLLLGLFLLLSGFILLIYSLDTSLGRPIAIAVGFGVSLLIVVIFALAMRARTAEGVRALEEALGFKEFLERVESDRYKRMITSPDLFERYLPYAMAFRVEGRWAAAFEDMYTAPPDWYSGSEAGIFHVTSFTRDLNRMSSMASSTMSSSPSSSGSGGGGSSGGGSGGGGGRGF